ncbi:MAG: hypothetical protein KKE20_04005 [Nanoarchaeota archaeon]|nr:hypothetical protein [Nanoarchaeota archaeon]
MKIELNMTKTHFWILIAVIVILGAGLFAIAQSSPNELAVWHTLKSISADSNGAVSVDANDNGVIDAAEGWRMLASGSDLTDEARITLNSQGISYETDSQTNSQRINAGLFEWPVYQPKEIAFKVRNQNDIFCVGGEGQLQLTSGSATNAKCTDYWYMGTTVTKKTEERNNWMRMNLNGESKITCPDVLGRTPTEGYPGTLGYKSDYLWKVMCNYRKGIDWTGDLTEIMLEEADGSGYGVWEWEIWYR